MLLVANKASFQEGESMEKKKNAGLAIGAIIIGLAALPVAALVNWVAGLVLLALPVFMVYKAS